MSLLKNAIFCGGARQTENSVGPDWGLSSSSKGSLMPRLANLGYIDVRRTTDPVRRRIRSRGVPPALAGREIFYTEEVHEASHLIAKALSPNTLTTNGFGAADFAASLHGARLRDVSLLYLDLHVPVHLDMPVTAPYVAVHMPTNGTALVTWHGVQVEANPVHAAVTSPYSGYSMLLGHDSPHLILRIELAALEHYLARFIGRTVDRPIEFEVDMDLSKDSSVRWHSAVQLLHTEILQAGSLVQQGIGIGPLEEFLMSTLLILQPSNYQRLFHQPAQRPGRRAVRRAVEYIESHLSEPVTMTQIADHVHMSVRSVQQGFRQELDVSPMAYLRDRRLDRVRGELADAIPSDGLTVTDVAMKWGFTHLSNFTMLYRRRFDQLPSETLRG
jgi:AraC-like DNA-binding protein